MVPILIIIIIIIIMTLCMYSAPEASFAKKNYLKLFHNFSRKTNDIYYVENLSLVIVNKIVNRLTCVCARLHDSTSMRLRDKIYH